MFIKISMSKTWSAHTMEFSALKRVDILTHGTAWVSSEDTKLSGRGHQGPGTASTHVEGPAQAAPQRQQMNVAQGSGWGTGMTPNRKVFLLGKMKMF